MLLPARALLRLLRPSGGETAGDGRSDPAAQRARDVKSLRGRMAAAARAPASSEAVALAERMRALRPAVLAAFGGVRACQGCARGRSEPHGHWDGGFCCGGRTEGVFDDDEVAALALAGTRPRDLQPPRGDLAGCAFRGPTGCSLAAEHRPNVCVRYACRELEAELRASGEWPRVRALTRELEETFASFVRARG